MEKISEIKLNEKQINVVTQYDMGISTAQKALESYLRGIMDNYEMEEGNYDLDRNTMIVVKRKVIEPEKKE